MSVEVGVTGYYMSSRGRKIWASVIGTHESIDPNGAVPRPEEGYVHIVTLGWTTGFEVRDNIPLKEVAEQIPDYTLEGKLVGYFQEV